MKSKISILIYSTVVLISILILWQQYTNRINNRITYFRSEIQQTILHINSINRLSLSQIEMLQTAAQSFFTHSSNISSPVYDMLQYNHEDDFFSLDQVPAPYTRDEIGNLFGIGDYRHRIGADRDVIHMAFALNPLFRQAKRNVPQSTWIYFASKDTFENCYPWASTDSINVFIDPASFYAADAYALSEPEKNPDRSIYLTKIYVDYAGQGLMVTLGAPVYRDDEFLGMVGLDLTVKTLSDILRDLNLPYLTPMIVNDDYQVIAHPTAITPKDEKPINVVNVMPIVLQDQLDKMMQSKLNSFMAISGYRMLRMDLEGVPWQFFALISNTNLNRTVIFQMMPLGVILLLFLITIHLFLRTWNANQLAKAEIEQRRKTEKNLVKARHEADQANKAKSLFLAKMSHELRTPLNAIMGYARLIQRDSTISSKHRSDLDVINQNGETLLGLINEVLDITKIETGQLELITEVTDLYKLLHDLQSIFNPRAMKKNLDLSFEWDHTYLPQYIQIDAAKLRDVLINLLDNAIKFTSQGGVILSARKDEKSNRLHIEVSDSGIGINPEFYDKIFQPFDRGEISSDAAPGSGLGLSISREYIRLMGGDLKVTSTLGKGSVFSLNVVFEEAKESDLPAKKPLRKVVGIFDQKRKYKVLIVDDIKSNRDFLVRLFDSIGFSTKDGSNGNDAIRINNEWAPDLILIDIRMPGMDGREAIQILRNQTHRSQLRIIAVTASAFQDDIKEFISLGADSAITKPFSESDLFNAIENLMNISFIWEEIDPEARATDISRLTHEEIRQLPKDVLQDLYDAIEMGDQDGAIQVIEGQREVVPELVKKITMLVNAYQGEHIMKLIENMKST